MTRIVRQLTQRIAPLAAADSLTTPLPALRSLITTTVAPLTTVTNSSLRLPDNFIPPTQPPSARPPAERKAQVIRSYTSLLRTTPLIILFQHNNLTAPEWLAVRRELNLALRQVGPADIGALDGQPVDLSEFVKLQVLRGRMFNVAMRIVEFHKDKTGELLHDLSQKAYDAITAAKAEKRTDTAHAAMEPLFSGPVAALLIPAISPIYLAAALSILAPSPEFPAPSRKKNPGYYEPLTQTALSKLILLGGRVEGKAFDHDGVLWVGGITGGLSTLQAQVVHMLHNAGMKLMSTLQGAGKALYVSLESHRQNLEPKDKKKEGEEENKE